MKFLLDTHSLLWVLADDSRLGERAKSEVLAKDNELYFSFASYWEICIKVSLGKLCLKEGWPELLDNEMDRLGISRLAIQQRHLLGVLQLPFHHRDPFDRLLIAQAACEAMTIITADPNIALYDIPCIF
jgi:PIN domain nuclease of toxin-antitoxin system